MHILIKAFQYKLWKMLYFFLNIENRVDFQSVLIRLYEGNYKVA